MFHYDSLVQDFNLDLLHAEVFNFCEAIALNFFGRKTNKVSAGNSFIHKLSYDGSHRLGQVATCPYELE